MKPCTQNRDEALGRVVEEMGEVGQIAGKILRFGWDGRRSPLRARYNNILLLKKEINDLKRAIATLEIFV